MEIADGECQWSVAECNGGGGTATWTTKCEILKRPDMTNFGEISTEVYNSSAESSSRADTSQLFLMGQLYVVLCLC